MLVYQSSMLANYFNWFHSTCVCHQYNYIYLHRYRLEMDIRCSGRLIDKQDPLPSSMGVKSVAKTCMEFGALEQELCDVNCSGGCGNGHKVS